MKVFVSSTSKDLYDFRQAVKEAILSQEWLPIMMENFEASPEETPEFCCRKVTECDLVVLLVGFNQGWVPDITDGGDGQNSITALEIETAKTHQIPILVFLANDSWPGKLWDDEQEKRNWTIAFRAGLNRSAKFFAHEDVKRDARPPVPQNFLVQVTQELIAHRDFLFKKLHEILFNPTAIPHMRQAVQELESLLYQADLPRDLVLEAYRDSHPQQIADLPRYGTCISITANAVSRLSVLPRSTDGQHPLLKFVKYVGCRSAPSTRLAFCEWYRKTAVCLGVSKHIAEAWQPVEIPAAPPIALEKTTASAMTAHVLVRCEPSGIKSGAFLVEAWLYEGDVRTGLPLEKVPWNGENRRRMLASLYNQALRIARFPKLLIIEFMVPRTHLNEEFDRWEMDHEDLGRIPLGEYFPVVVRFLERCKPAASLPLRRRWHKIETHLKTPCRIVDLEDHAGSAPPKALWLAQRPQNGDHLFRHLSLHETIACVVLPSRPKDGKPGSKKDVSQALLATGIPVGLWPRTTSSDPQGIEQILTDLLRDHPLDELPWRLHQHRLQRAYTVASANRLTLIWDDPTRIAPMADEESPLGLEIQD